MNVKLIANTENPELVIATAAKLCYSPSKIEDLMNNLSESNIESFINMLADMGHCYDKDTEVLTNQGFIKWSKFNKTYKLAAVDPKTRILKGFEKATNFIVREVDEDLIRFNTNNIDLLVTNKHKLYCSLSKTESARKNPIFNLIEAENIYDKPMRMTKAAINNNNDILENDVIFSLYGFFIGDGYADKNSKNQLQFHLKLDRKINYLKDLCNQLNYTLEERPNNKYVVIKNNIANDFRTMFYDLNTNSKTFPDQFYNMSANQFNYFIDGLKNSDGSIKRDTWTYTSTSELLIDKIQTLGSINNTVFTKQKTQNNVFKLNINSRTIMPHLNDSRLNNYATKEHYKGNVYCATVSTGLLIVRRNGIISLCGNCSPFEHVSFTFAVEGVSRVLEQQLTRHRLASYSIQSGRYVERGNAEFYMPGDIESNLEACEIYMDIIESTKDAYEKIWQALLHQYLIAFYNKNTDTNLIDLNDREFCFKFFGEDKDLKIIFNKYKKKALENARMVFPNSLETKIIFTMNARTLFNFFAHRCCNRAQDEIKELAYIMLNIVKEIAPNIFKNAGPHCKSLKYCPENNMQCDQLKGKLPTHKDVIKLINENWNK